MGAETCRKSGRHNLAAPCGKLRTAAIQRETTKAGRLHPERESRPSDHPSNLTGYGLSSHFKYFCSSVRTQTLQTSQRRLQRRTRTLKGITDNEYFGSKTKLQGKLLTSKLQSEKAVSTTNTVSSNVESPLARHERIPEELKVEDQTVSEILSLNSAEQT